MLDKQAAAYWHHLRPRVTATARRDAEYRAVFAPIESVQELRDELALHKKGKTGRLTTIDELDALEDDWFEPVVLLLNLILAGETPAALKLGDVAPNPNAKDLQRARPITCLDRSAVQDR